MYDLRTAGQGAWDESADRSARHGPPIVPLTSVKARFLTPKAMDVGPSGNRTGMRKLFASPSTLRSFAALALVGACGLATGPQLIGSGPAILFIGNSYTYENDLPGMVEALARATGSPVAVASVAKPDFALIDHYNGGSSARSVIARGGWKYVVLQQGPSSVEVNRDTLRLATRLFDADIRKVGATPALFSAWPSDSRRVDFPRAIESYQLAAADVNGVFLPVAGAWLAAWERDPTIVLYDGDGLHASPAGSYLTALVILSKLTGQSPIGSPAQLTLASGARVTLPSALAAILQEAAAAPK